MSMKKLLIVGIIVLISYGIYKASSKKKVVVPTSKPKKLVVIGDNTANPAAARMIGGNTANPNVK